MNRTLLPMFLAACTPEVPVADAPPDGLGGVVLTTAAIDYTSGALAVIDPDHTVHDPLATVHGDAVVEAVDGAVYVINRLLMDTVRRIDPPAWSSPTWEASAGPGTNPHDVAALAGGLVVSRYGEAALLRLDPATGEALGLIDLSAHADEDGVPEASDLLPLPTGDVAVGLQRLRRDAAWVPDPEGRVVILDGATGEVRAAWPVGPNPVLRGTDPLLVIADGGVSALDPDLGTLTPFVPPGDGDVIDGGADTEGAVLIHRDGERHRWSCVQDGEVVFGPWLDRYVTDVALSPDGTAWLATRPPWSDPLGASGVLTLDRSSCEAVGDGLTLTMPPFSIAAWGAW